MIFYRKVDVRLWSDEKFAALSPLPPSGQSLWLFFLTNPFPGYIPGLIKAGPAMIAEELGWSMEAFGEAFGEALALGLAKANPEARLIWLPNAIKYNPPASPNVIRSWGEQFETMPKCDLLFEAVGELEKALSIMGEGYTKAFSEVKPLRKPLRKPSPKASPKPSPNHVSRITYHVTKEKEKNSAAPAAPASKPLDRDSLRDALAESFKAKVPVYANPVKENSNLLKLALAIRRKAEAEKLSPEEAAQGTLQTFWRLHESGKSFYADFTPSKMLAIFESLWGEWTKDLHAFDASWVDDLIAQEQPQAITAGGGKDDGF